METIKTDATIKVPREVASCPYCKADLYVEMEEWEQDDDGTWYAVNPKGQCEREPDIDSDDWEYWIEVHSDMPYVYQLPVDIRIEAWMKENYRFELGTVED